MTTPLTGGCACGAVRYECATESVMAFNCHCRDCQRATGGAYVPAVVVPRDALRVTGEVRYFGVREGKAGRFLIGASAQTAVRDYLASRTSSQDSW
jgi:hypothetical protein